MRRSRAVTLVAFVAAVRHRIELRRRRNHPQLGAAVLLGATFGTVLVVGWLPVPYYGSLWPEPGAYYYGSLVGDEPDAVLALAREICAIAVVATAALGALGAATSDDWEEPPVELVTAIPLPAAIFGVLGEELLESGWFVVPIAAGGALAFSAGTGEPATLVGALAGAGATVGTGLIAGTAAGVAVRAAIRRSPRLYAARYAVGVAVVFLTFTVLALSRRAGAVLASTPLGWHGDLLFLTIPGGGANVANALFVLAGCVVVVAASLALAVPAARSLWFAEAILDDGTVDASDSPSRIDVVLERLVGRPTTAVVRGTWRRIHRSPRAMVYVLLPFALAGPATVELSRTTPGLAPVLITLYAACAVGLGTTLNPLGNERTTLSLFRTTPDGHRTVLRGHALAALLPGVPFVLCVGTVVALASGYPPAALVSLVLGGVVLAVAGVGVSLGIGAFLPNLEGPTAATLTPPELYAMIAYLVAMVVAATPAFVGLGADPGGVGGSSILTTLSPVAVTALVSGVLGVGGYRYATGVLERYDGEDG